MDHGKTTIVEGITGVWTSDHSEELRRGITIKVGYADAAFYKCPSCPSPQCYSTSPKCPECEEDGKLLRAVSFVDAPGHESLMANTLSGAALMDGSILVIAANEKVPQPQTREHLLALEMLGMKHIVIALNKIDLIDDSRSLAAYGNIEAFLEGSVAEGAPIIPISAQRRLNIDALIEAVEGHIPTPQRDPKAKPLMHILRSFDVNRPGYSIDEMKGGVVGGSVIRGEIRVGDEVEFGPGIVDAKSGKYERLIAEVASLGTGAGLVEKVTPGGLVALGTTLDSALTKSDALVGSVLGLPGELPPIHTSLTLEINLFDAAVCTPDLVKVEKMNVGEPFRLNVGTAVTLGTTKSIKNGLAEVDLRRPVAAEEGSRVAISRRIGDRWRLIGSGILK